MSSFASPAGVDLDRAAIPPLRAIHECPALGAEGLQRLEADLVGHLPAGCDPIAEIDIGQAAPAGFLDQAQHDEAAQAVGRTVGIEEAVDGGEPVARPVHQAAGDERALVIAQLEEAAVDGGVIDHRAIIGKAHAGHFPFAMAPGEIAVEEGVLLGCRLGRADGVAEAGIAPHHPAQRPPGLELVDDDPHRHAFLAAVTGGPVGDGMAAPEARPGQQVIALRGIGPAELRHQLALAPSGQIGTGGFPRQQEDERPGPGLDGHARARRGRIRRITTTPLR